MCSWRLVGCKVHGTFNSSFGEGMGNANMMREKMDLGGIECFLIYTEGVGASVYNTI
jgi:hypothetical protein